MIFFDKVTRDFGKIVFFTVYTNVTQYICTFVILIQHQDWKKEGIQQRILSFL